MAAYDCSALTHIRQSIGPVYALTIAQVEVPHLLLENLPAATTLVFQKSRTAAVTTFWRQPMQQPQKSSSDYKGEQQMFASPTSTSSISHSSLKLIPRPPARVKMCVIDGRTVTAFFWLWLKSAFVTVIANPERISCRLSSTTALSAAASSEYVTRASPFSVASAFL